MKPPLMSHEDRRRLIEAPIAFRIIERKTWAGTLIGDPVPTDGKRTRSRGAWDEEFYATWEEGD